MSANKNTVDVLFFGDIVGRPGRQAVQWYLSSLLRDHERPDVIMANVENASHGFGLSEKNYQELLDAGIHIMTGGNHIWDRKDILTWVDEAHALLRPANFPANSPGRGAGLFEIGQAKVGVINLIGQVFMGNYNSPWEQLDYWVEQLREQTSVIFVDFHAEATAEKLALARYASSLGVSAFTGTHTHVQTADERILNNRTGYITDTGFCGAHDSVIGFFPEGSIQRLKEHLPARIEVADSTLIQINASCFTIDIHSGVCKAVRRVNIIRDLNPLEPIPTQAYTSVY